VIAKWIAYFTAGKCVRGSHVRNSRLQEIQAQKLEGTFLFNLMHRLVVEDKLNPVASCNRAEMTQTGFKAWVQEFSLRLGL
jgi:hypothetical protein